MRPVLRSSADAILLIDRNLRISDVNGAARKVLGRPGQKLLGRRYKDVLRWDAGEDDWGLFQRTESALPSTKTLYRHAAGRPQKLAIRAFQLKDMAGEFEGIFAVIKLIAQTPATSGS